MDQQLVQVIAAEQRLARQERLSALPLGLHQGEHLALARPAYFEWLEGHEQTADGGARPTCAAGEQGHSPEIPGKNFDNQTGFPKGIGVQNVGRLAVDLAAQAHS
ncbi:hypothetical protein SDC9_202597 [bioreactor metagenome]|uniref:Uncharacterized protein n=1 Tax=bioreactor metagenome TaxID=1076179 RepID=A0A645IU26_9ZZZZ